MTRSVCFAIQLKLANHPAIPATEWELFLEMKAQSTHTDSWAAARTFWLRPLSSKWTAFSGAASHSSRCRSRTSTQDIGSPRECHSETQCSSSPPRTALAKQSLSSVARRCPTGWVARPMGPTLLACRAAASRRSCPTARRTTSLSGMLPKSCLTHGFREVPKTSPTIVSLRLPKAP